MSVQPIILAAGKGTRMGNPDLPKVLNPIAGQPIISYLLKSLAQADFLPPVLVVGYHGEQVRAALGDGYTYIEQGEQLGTGHAVLACKEALKGKADRYIIMYGDQPLWTCATMCRLVDEHVEGGDAFSLVTLVSNNPAFHDFGRILRDERGMVAGIRELKDCTPEQVAIQEYNPSMYCAEDSWLWGALEEIRPNNVKHEYYLTDLLEIAIGQGKQVCAVQTEDWQEALGINTPEQLAEASKYLR